MHPIKLNTIVMMTATVQPPSGMPGSVRSDPALRFSEYCEALDFYLSLPDSIIQGIVVLENSDVDFAPMKEIVKRSSSGKNVEFIHTNSDYPPENGKGYGEFLMIDEGMSKSHLLQNAKHIWKVTGRLRIRNMSELISSAPMEYELLADLRSVPLIGESLGGNDWMELRVFSFTPNLYNELFKGQFNAAFVLEKYFFQLIYRELQLGRAGLNCRFKIQPDLIGFSGHSNKSYQNFSYRSRSMLRRIGRKFFPFIWL